MKNKLFVFLFITFIFLTYAYSYYYADIEIDINPNGEMIINGISNHPILQNKTAHFSYKSNQYTIINFTLQNFSTYIAKIKFPENAVLHYIKADNLLYMGNENNRIVLTLIGKNEPLTFFVKYTLNEKNNFIEKWIYIIPLILIGFIIIVTLFILPLKKTKKSDKFNYNSLNERQKHIINLIKKKKEITQGELQKILKMPKSSLSRNINSLEKRGIIIKEKRGMSNFLRFK